MATDFANEFSAAPAQCDHSPRWNCAGDGRQPRTRLQRLRSGPGRSHGGVMGSEEPKLDAARGGGFNRGYHATAVLLPDATVLSAGGGEGAGGYAERNGQIFHP